MTKRAVPGARADYGLRRQVLGDAIGDDSIAVIPAAPERTRNRDVLHPYRQDSDFLYLTGVSESDMVLVIAPGSEAGDTLLFCRAAQEREALYDGARLTPDEAPQRLGVDQAFDLDDLDEVMTMLVNGRQRVLYPLGGEFDARVVRWTARGRSGANFGAPVPDQFEDLRGIVHEMRLHKDSAEIELMRGAAAINAVGHERAMRSCRPGLTELRLEAELRYGWALEGAREVAYPPIVAAGANACVMHYHAGAATLNDGDLVLIDAGPELEGYASDVTRTFPINGQFSPPQRAVYDVVLAAQHAALAAAMPGNDFDAPQRAADRVFVEGLVELGLLNGSVDALLERRAFAGWTIHRLSHWLGLDVHDVGSYTGDGESLEELSAFRTLESGMVLTIEPGLYFPATDMNIPVEFRGIGIRIEDDVLIGDTGQEVLTAAIPRDPEALEALIGHA